MDCYPEYHYHHYNGIHNPYFSSANNPSMHRFGSAQLATDNHPSPFYEGFSRHNVQSHHHHNSFGGQGSNFSSSFESSNENSQFYYANMHQHPASSYYGNQHHHHQHSPHATHQNTYDSYPYNRNIPSNYRYHYGYHQSQHYPPPQMQSHSPHHHFYPLQQHQQPYNSSNSPDHHHHHHYNHYPSSPTSNATPTQQGNFNSSTNSIRSNEFSSQSQFNVSAQSEGQNNEKLLDKDIKHSDALSINRANEAKMNESDDKTHNTPDDQQVTVNPLSSPNENKQQDENSSASKEISKDGNAVNKNDDNNNDNNNNNNNNNVEGEDEVAKKHKNESFNENENCKENHQQHTQNEEATPATDYSPESSKVNKISQENEKQQNAAAINRLSEHHNVPNLHDRSPTPYTNHSNIPSHNYSHKRYPMSWYTHDYYNNWMMSQDDRRNFPDPQTFFSSMRSKSKSSDKHKMHHDNSPSSTKRTKRKPKVEEPIPKVDPNKDKMKNVTPLPGFLQTFGQTEIGKFSEAFYTSDSPMHYSYNNIESDIDSPQLDWDSLDGPIGNPMQVSSFYMYGSENEFDSPINSFSEIMCKDF